MKNNLFQRLEPVYVLVNSPPYSRQKMIYKGECARESYKSLRLATKKAVGTLGNHAQLARRSFHRIGIWRRKK
ncbi:MAG: hypothetical protein AAB881_00640 [Patescibacteria group bacterium]